MDALSVISLDQAKSHLRVDFNDYDEQISGIIKTAVSMVEQYTDYFLYQRPKSYIIASNKTSITDFPLQLTGVNDPYGQPVPSFQIGIFKGALTTYITYFGFIGALTGQPVINTLVGYASPADIPQPLIGAAYKLITYLFENKDAYAATIPYDVQLMLNQFRRSATI